MLGPSSASRQAGCRGSTSGHVLNGGDGEARTDFPGEPIRPCEASTSAFTSQRRDEPGTPRAGDPEQRLTRDEAIRSKRPRPRFGEGRGKGTLHNGMYADSCSVRPLPHLPAPAILAGVMTGSAGRVVYEKR